MQEKELIQRMERLERRTLRWKLAALILLLGCLVLLLAGFVAEGQCAWSGQTEPQNTRGR